MTGCCVPECHNSTRKNYFLKVLPRDPIRRTNWVKNIGLVNLMRKERTYLCETTDGVQICKHENNSEGNKSVLNTVNWTMSLTIEVHRNELRQGEVEIISESDKDIEQQNLIDNEALKLEEYGESLNKSQRKEKLPQTNKVIINTDPKEELSRLKQLVFKKTHMVNIYKKKLKSTRRDLGYVDNAPNDRYKAALQSIFNSDQI
ncbi:uncharacterized protein [Neodiprion pinetum]|uniref:uncharacterized protein isoform X1 n=1 Tax=Neodiprion pinetum TaxID=441929 RepID=UPI001EE0C6D8|nr:uncharacterized protein LOC124211380 isoform X1 [Neodiprion pinetum]